MKVLCINDKWTPHPNIAHLGGPVVGDIDTVVKVHDFSGRDFYELKRFGPDAGFRVDFFAPLSEIDETKLVNQKTETV